MKDRINGLTQENHEKTELENWKRSSFKKSFPD